MHLTPLKGVSEGDFYTLFDFAISAAFRNMSTFLFFMSLLLLLIFTSHRTAGLKLELSLAFILSFGSFEDGNTPFGSGY